MSYNIEDESLEEVRKRFLQQHFKKHVEVADKLLELEQKIGEYKKSKTSIDSDYCCIDHEKSKQNLTGDILIDKSIEFAPGSPFLGEEPTKPICVIRRKRIDTPTGDPDTSDEALQFAYALLKEAQPYVNNAFKSCDKKCACSYCSEKCLPIRIKEYFRNSSEHDMETPNV